jgi:hypothetical protein
MIPEIFLIGLTLKDQILPHREEKEKTPCAVIHVHAHTHQEPPTDGASEATGPVAVLSVTPSNGRDLAAIAERLGGKVYRVG